MKKFQHCFFIFTCLFFLINTISLPAFSNALQSQENEIKQIDRYFAIGKVLINQEKWSKASKEFDKILKLEPENIEAHYYRGICHREYGKFRQLLALIKDWPNAEKHFKKVIAKDSLFKDIFYQFALLQRYRKKYTQAIQLGHKQIRSKPQLIKAQIGLLDLYRHYIDHKNMDEAISWLSQQQWDQARYYIGEKLRREGKTQEADSIFKELLASDLNMRKQPIFLSMIRSKFDNHEPEEVENYFWLAVDGIQSHLDSDLVFEDIKYIVTQDEFDSYRAMDSVNDKIPFFRTFWASRDPTPASKQNARLIEHYRRLIYAEENYEFDAFRTWANNPDQLNYIQFPETFKLNQWLDDRGVIYLRHGPPDDEIRSVASVSNQSWLYYAREANPEMTFHFLKPGQIWRLSAKLDDPAMLNDRSHWNSGYYRASRASTIGERFAASVDMAVQRSKEVTTALTTDRHSWDREIKPLDLPYTIVTFKGESGKTTVEVYYGFPIQTVAKSLADTITVMQIESGLAVHSMGWHNILKQPRILDIPFKRSELHAKDLVFDLFRVTMEPDSYRVAFHAKPNHTNLLGGYQNLLVNLPDYSSPYLSISDILLATSIHASDSPGKFTRHGLKIIPNIMKSFEIDRPVYIYFEVYNLELAAEMNSFSIEYTIQSKKANKGKVFGLFGKGRKISVTVSSDRKSNSTFSFEHLAIDVSNLKKGKYTLEIKITDQINRQFVNKETSITLK